MSTRVHSARQTPHLSARLSNNQDNIHFDRSIYKNNSHSAKLNGSNSSQLDHCKQLRTKAIRHYNCQDYFDTLIYSQKCCKSLQDKFNLECQETDILSQLQHTCLEALPIATDCFMYSSLAYMQLQQHQQALSLLNQVVQFSQ